MTITREPENLVGQGMVQVCRDTPPKPSSGSAAIMAPDSGGSAQGIARVAQVLCSVVAAAQQRIALAQFAAATVLKSRRLCSIGRLNRVYEVLSRLPLAMPTIWRLRHECSRILA